MGSPSGVNSSFIARLPEEDRQAIKSGQQERWAAAVDANTQQRSTSRPPTDAAYANSTGTGSAANQTVPQNDNERAERADARILAAGDNWDQLHLINPRTGREYTDEEVREIYAREADVATAAGADAVQDIEATSEAWLEHNEELNYYIQTAGQILTPDELSDAVQDYIDNQSDEWRSEHERLESELAGAGERYLLALNENQLANGDPDDFADRNDPATQMAIALALNENPSLVENLDVERLIPALGEQGGRQIANAQFQHEVIDRFAALDGGSEADVAAAREGIDTLRNQTFADVFTNDGDLESWNDTLDALDATLDAEDAVAAHDALVAELSDSSSIDEDSGLALTLQSLSLAAAYGGDQEFSVAQELDLSDRAALINDGLTAAIGYPVAALDFPTTGPLTGSANFASKFIGAASVGLAAYNVVDSAASGDAAGVAFNSGALAGSVLAFWAPGPGTAIALGFSAISVTYNQLKKVELSNQYTTLDSDTRENAINFITHADLDRDAAIALLDRSGDGHSAIPLFLRLGEHNGWDLDQTLDHINELHADGDLNTWRDHYHHALDRTGGDASEVELYDVLHLERPATQPAYGHAPDGRGGPNPNPNPPTRAQQEGRMDYAGVPPSR